MRTLVRVEIPVESGSKAIVEGKMGKIVSDFVEKAKPEAAYFGTYQGKRTAYFVIDMQSSADMPPLLESLFIQLNASIDIAPVMNAEELRTGLSRMG